MTHRIIVDWPDTSFPTSDAARNATRIALTDAAKSLQVNEPNVEQFIPQSNVAGVGALPRDEAALAAMNDEFAQSTDAMLWAKEFAARVRAGLDPTDEGWLVGWFANAMAVGERTSRPRHHDEVATKVDTEIDPDADRGEFQ